MKSFDLAHNNFSGDVPSFMAEGELSTRTKIVISLLVGFHSQAVGLLAVLMLFACYCSEYGIVQFCFD